MLRAACVASHHYKCSPAVEPQCIVTEHMHTHTYTHTHTHAHTHTSRLQACYEETLGEKSSWSEMCTLYNAYCAKLGNIGAMSSTEFLTVLRWGPHAAS